MRFRTVLNLALVLTVVGAIVSILVTNDVVLQQSIRIYGDKSIPIWAAVVFAFLTGVVLTSLGGISQQAGTWLERWRLRRATRRSEAIEDEYTKGLVAVLEGHDAEALRHFRAVLEQDSRHFNTLIQIGDVLRAQGKWAEAIEYHRKAHHLKDDDTRPLYALAEDYASKGDAERARAVLDRIIGLSKSSVAAWRKLRSLHMKEGNWERALDAHDRVLKLSLATSGAEAPDRATGPGIRYELARSQMRAGKLRDAIAELRRLVKRQERFIPAHVALGEALHEDGQEAEALAAWYRGFEATGSPVFLIRLEEHYLDREQPLGAIEALKRCISSARKDTLPRFYLGKLYFRLEMLDDAFALLSSLEGRAVYAPSLHYLMGRIHERRRNFREAANEYRKVIKEMELVQLDFKCRACGETLEEWSGRCRSCGQWNTIEVNFREEIPLEELGLSTAPIYTAES